MANQAIVASAKEPAPMSSAKYGKCNTAKPCASYVESSGVFAALFAL